MSSTAKQHFVLVHGRGHGAWCWYKVRCRLEQSGHSVTCIDLAGCGVDLTDVTKIHTFDDYHKPLFDFMSALPDKAKVVLVGHSSGGLAVTRAEREFSEKVLVAVYVAACMLRNGFSTPQDYEAAAPDMSEYGDYTELLINGVLKPKYQRMLLYNLSPPEDVTLASMLLRPAVSIPDEHIPGGEGDTVRRVYVKTLQDRIIKPKQQEMMIQMWPPSQVFALESDHSPFFSVTDQLCDVLLNVCSCRDFTSRVYPCNYKPITFRGTKVEHRNLVQHRHDLMISAALLLLLLLLLLAVSLLSWAICNSMLMSE